MIRSFKHKGLRQLFEAGNARGVNAAHVQRVTDILDLLNAAMRPGDMDFPGSFFHPLKGKLKGHWAVRVSGNWRVIFVLKQATHWTWIMLTIIERMTIGRQR